MVTSAVSHDRKLCIIYGVIIELPYCRVGTNGYHNNQMCNCYGGGIDHNRLSHKVIIELWMIGLW